MSIKNRITLIKKVTEKFGKFSDEYFYCMMSDDKTLKSFCEIFFHKSKTI